MNKDELVNVALIIILGILIGGSGLLYRDMLPTIFSSNLIKVHYSIAHIIVGTMPIMFLQAETPQGRATAIFVFFAVLLIVAVAPVRLLLNGMITMTVLFGSIAYFKFFAGKSTNYLAGVSLLLFELYAYAVWIMVRAFRNTDDLYFVLPPIFLTAMLGLLLNSMRDEYRKATSGSAGAQGWGL